MTYFHCVFTSPKFALGEFGLTVRAASRAQAIEQARLQLTDSFATLVRCIAVSG
jgi:hypothetical protein